jgi:hypothetical protein
MARRKKSFVKSVLDFGKESARKRAGERRKRDSMITAHPEALPIGLGMSTVLVSLICGCIWWILNNKKKR